MDLLKALKLEKEKQERLRKIVVKNVVGFVVSTGVIYVLRLVLPNHTVVRVAIFIVGFFTGEVVGELITMM